MIGDTLKKLRVRSGLTQEQIASDPNFGVNANTLASYEKNVREPKLPTLVKLAQYFGVTTDYLLGLSNYETPDKEITGQTIQLSNEALDFLLTCDLNQMSMISQILSAPHAVDFLTAFIGYLEKSSIIDSDGQLDEKYLPLLDHINRRMSDTEFAAFVERWSWDSLEKALLSVIDDVRNQIDIDRRTREGRPKRGKYKKKAKPDQPELIDQEV